MNRYLPVDQFGVLLRKSLSMSKLYTPLVAFKVKLIAGSSKEAFGALLALKVPVALVILNLKYLKAD